MLRSLRSHLRRARLMDLPLEFTLDLDEQGRHVARVYTVIGGQREQFEDIRNLWSYGFVLEREEGRYAICNESLETLLAMRSLNPDIRQDGAMVFDICPPVLRYLRTRDSINEAPESEQLQIADKPLEPASSIDYEPNKGLTVKAGYRQEGAEDLITSDQLELTPDGGYVRIEKVFYPLDRNLSPTVREWLDRATTTVSLDGIPEFFKRDLVLLRTEMNAVLTERAGAIQVIDSRFDPRVSVTLGEPGWLDFKVDYVVAGYELPRDLIRRTKDRYVHTDDNTWIELDSRTIAATEKNLRELGAEITAEGFRVPVTQFASIEEFIEQIGGIRELSAEYSRFLHQITDFQSDEAFMLPADFELRLTARGIHLRPYQRAGIHWLNWLMIHHLHGVLADDMGLGKTIQTIATVGLRYREEEIAQHSLIACPKSVVHFWVREIKRCMPDATIYEYVGPSRNRSLWKASKPVIFISTYETVARDVGLIRSVPLFFLVLDEATKIKNPDAKRTRAIKSLNSVHRIALSGTPIENRPAELWSLFDFLMKGHLGTYGRFVRVFENPITSGDDGAARQLSNRIRPFILRRLKEEVAKDLPEKIEMDEWCELTDEQKSLYGQIQDTFAAPVRLGLKRGQILNYATSILPVLTKLKQVCDHPSLITGKVEPVSGRSEKFDLVVEKVEEICAAGERVVLFSHFLSTLDLLEIAFQRRGISYIRLDGSTANRQLHIDRFNAHEADTALCSIQACGHGITLTAANHVIHINRWWNPAVEDQATDRVHRIGQDKTVYVHRILTMGTLEEKIALLLEKKRDISDRVIGAAVGQEMKWTREELLELLKPIE